MTIWVKPSGLEININDNKATVEYAESLGWVKKGQASKKDEAPKKRGRPAKIRTED